MSPSKCTSCGTFVKSDERYCSSCGENNPKFVEVSQSSTSSTSYSSNSSSSNSNSTDTRSGIGWLILGLFLPLVGYILFFSLKKENPTASSMSLTGAIIGTLIGLNFI
jgi:uncharacterized membrane protein YvbJ